MTDRQWIAVVLVVLIVSVSSCTAAARVGEYLDPACPAAGKGKADHPRMNK